MTDINYKESQWDLFVEESFGKHTYATLLLFNHNAHNIKKMIEFYWNLLTSDKTLNNNENSSKKRISKFKTYDFVRFNSKNSIIDRNFTCINRLLRGRLFSLSQ